MTHRAARLRITHRGQPDMQIDRHPFRPADLYPGRAASTEIGEDMQADTAIVAMIALALKTDMSTRGLVSRICVGVRARTAAEADFETGTARQLVWAGGSWRCPRRLSISGS